jgi:carbon storage regulator
MLVLSRKINETIVIDGDIRITVVGLRGSQVRLGFEAPDSVGISRQELCTPAEASRGAEGPAPGRVPSGRTVKHAHAVAECSDPRR